MNVANLMEEVSAGSIVAIVIIILSLIEFVPIKISPLAIIGKRLNKETLDKVEGIEKKLDEHVAQSLRTKILNFQDDVVGGLNKTKEQWVEVVNAIYKYEKYCEDNKINNGLCKEASQFLLNTYQYKLQHHLL